MVRSDLAYKSPVNDTVTTALTFIRVKYDLEWDGEELGSHMILHDKLNPKSLENISSRPVLLQSLFSGVHIDPEMLP